MFAVVIVVVVVALCMIGAVCVMERRERAGSGYGTARAKHHGEETELGKIAPEGAE